MESVIEIVAKRLKRGEIVEPKVKSMGQKFQFFGKFQDIHHMVARFSPVNQLSCASPKPFMLPHKFFVYRFGTLMPFACYRGLIAAEDLILDQYFSHISSLYGK